MNETTEPSWPVQLFNRSVLKQRKFHEITRLLGEAGGLACLDIGSDNGVISFLLRRRGGRWKSADLDENAVRCIRSLVHQDVYRIGGLETPFQNNEFDRVVIVDFLEHIRTDAEFVRELHRIIKPGGELIVNVPHAKQSLLRRFRHWIGQTDEKHGHVRPGYTLESLKKILAGRFSLKEHRTYSRFFSECVDTLITAVFDRLKKDREASSKGLVVSARDVNRYRRLFRLYGFIYPFVWFFAKLDTLLFWTSGYMLIARAKIDKT